MTAHATTAAPRARPSALHALGSCLERRRQRRALLRLSDAMLRDIGISHPDGWRESREPFWRA
jgi:uncharacterized protein YjiS (DUF1127 family)